MVFHGTGHGRRGLARTDHDQTPFDFAGRGQVGWNAQLRLSRGDGRLEHLAHETGGNLLHAG